VTELFVDGHPGERGLLHPVHAQQLAHVRHGAGARAHPRRGLPRQALGHRDLPSATARGTGTRSPPLSLCPERWCKQGCCRGVAGVLRHCASPPVVLETLGDGPQKVCAPVSAFSPPLQGPMAYHVFIGYSNLIMTFGIVYAVIVPSSCPSPSSTASSPTAPGSTRCAPQAHPIAGVTALGCLFMPNVHWAFSSDHHRQRIYQ